MVVQKIGYDDKQAIQNDEEVEEINKVTADNLNEIKETVNNNAEVLDDLNGKYETFVIDAISYKGSVETFEDLENLEDVSQGDVYTVLDEEKNYAYNGESWFLYSETNANYATKEDVTINRGIITLEDTVEPNTNYILPFYYEVGNNSLEIFYNGSKLERDADYIEVGDKGEISSKIKFLDSVGALDMSDVEEFDSFVDTLEIIIRGDYGEVAEEAETEEETDVGGETDTEEEMDTSEETGTGEETDTGEESDASEGTDEEERETEGETEENTKEEGADEN